MGFQRSLNHQNGEQIPLQTCSLRDLTDVIGRIPYRMALAGGWIDQPFVSKLNPAPPGAMVVVNLEPVFRFMEFCGMGTSTRKVALRLWAGQLPGGDPARRVRELYAAENAGRPDPSGSQDMAGIIYPGISRLDYDFAVEGGVFPSHVETLTDPEAAVWLEQVIQVLPVAPRPVGYSPLGVQNLDPAWVCRLGQSGRDCFESIRRRDVDGLGASLNETMRCWEALLPHTVRHPGLVVDLMSLLEHYQSRCAGAMYSGCGGGYLYLASRDPVPGAFRVKIRVQPS
jgi:hypothetical protein